MHVALARAMRSAERALPIAPSAQQQLKASLVERAAPVYWHGAVRQLLAVEPEVLD